MKNFKKIFIFLLIIGIAGISACGVRRDLKPKNESQEKYGVPKYDAYKEKYRENRIIKF